MKMLGAGPYGIIFLNQNSYNLHFCHLHQFSRTHKISRLLLPNRDEQKIGD